METCLEAVGYTHSRTGTLLTQRLRAHGPPDAAAAAAAAAARLVVLRILGCFVEGDVQADHVGRAQHAREGAWAADA